ncbi:MAG: hypothetical protein U1C58_04410 [Flavobacteriaceae bacterium]|nr:hypothetical protein [Flavobacteriaceae bacterium]MDZ4147507.1 hypothetical protein [Flavobacteriaceae bacterium]
MKNIFKIIPVLLILLTAFVSCEDEDKNPFNPTQFENGAVLRTISIPSSSIDLFNIETSFYAVEVEFFVDGETSSNSLLESVDVFVRYRDNTAFNGINNVDEIPFGNIPASAFAVGPSGFPRTIITVDASDAIAALGLDTDTQVDGGDIISIRLALKLTTGQVFTDENKSGDIPGNFFRSPFAYDAGIVCALPNTVFVGAYQLTVTEDGDLTAPDAFGVRTYNDQAVTITATSGTRRVIQSLAFLPAFGGFVGPLTFDLVCGRTIAPNQAAGGGVGCGSGGIRLETQGEFGLFDIDDESSFTLIFNNFVADGGCGVAPHRVIIRFDKL